MNFKKGQRVKLDSLLKYTAVDTICTLPDRYLTVQSTIKFNSKNILVKLDLNGDEFLLYQFNDRLYFFEAKFTLESETPEMVECDTFDIEADSGNLQYKDHTGLYEEVVNKGELYDPDEPDVNEFLFRMYSRRITETEEFLLGYMSNPEEQHYAIGIRIIPQQLVV